jgi:translation initiation factor 3 subunit E
MAPFNELIDPTTCAVTATGADIIDANSFTPEYLAEQHGISADTIEALFRCAKFRYECGEYEEAAELLKYYRELVPVESEASLRALWGKFVADIVSTRFEAAENDCDKLSALIARAPGGLSELQALQQRTWMLHWSLFVWCNLPKGGKDLLIDFFLIDANLNAVQLNAPWLLRYLTAAILTSKKRATLTRTLLRVVTQESAAYSDPVRGARASCAKLPAVLLPCCRSTAPYPLPLLLPPDHRLCGGTAAPLRL